MSCCDLRPEPNLKEFTPEEMRALSHKWYELSEAGFNTEAEQLVNQIPVLPELAQVLKEQQGIETLIASGINLSRAVKAYGNDWLNK